MRTLKDPHQPGTPASVGRHEHREELAVLTRANHDMRSPLSVILGVFELLEDTGSLTDGERRYLALGSRAAEELLILADGLRLYSALERNLVSLDVTPVDLGGLAQEELAQACQERGVNLDVLTDDCRAMGDEGYLKLALAGLARHAVTHLPDASQAPATLTIRQHQDGSGVTLQVAAEGAAEGGDADPAPGPAECDELGVLNGIRLIEMMGGSASIRDRGVLLTVTLPAAR